MIITVILNFQRISDSNFQYRGVLVRRTLASRIIDPNHYLNTNNLPSSEIFYGTLGICPAICHPVICLFSKVAFPNKSSINPKNDLLLCDMQQPLFEVEFTVCKYKLIDATSNDLPPRDHIISHTTRFSTLYNLYQARVPSSHEEKSFAGTDARCTNPRNRVVISGNIIQVF